MGTCMMKMWASSLVVDKSLQHVVLPGGSYGKAHTTNQLWGDFNHREASVARQSSIGKQRIAATALSEYCLCAIIRSKSSPLAQSSITKCTELSEAEQPSTAAGKAGMTRTPLNRDDPNPFGLTILHGELNGDSQAILVIGSLFSDIFSDLFWGETQMIDLGSERTGGADLASDDSDVDIDDLRGVEFRRHGRRGRR
ncbi:hypothetical protein DVH24_019125 [Malus domestica]|uniref:Uncharacterized protein n=1 Tax=Malus domestica TaxID=3750 RepID=A0A498I2T2_MALDO|nr:hypothetical protein DVH24_019125 [Malus domestica]